MSNEQNAGRVTTITRPAHEDLRPLEDQANIAILAREDIRVWEQSGVERVSLDDGRTAILKYAIPMFSEADALTFADVHGVPVPTVFASADLPSGSAAILLEDLGPSLRAPSLEDAAEAAVAIHSVPGPPGRPVLDSDALAELPERALENLDQLQGVDRWTGEGAAALREDLERIGRLAHQRSRGAEIPPYGFAHSEFHPTSIHIGHRGRRVLDFARSYTGNGLLDLASWQGTIDPLDVDQVKNLLGAYVHSGAEAGATSERGGLPAHVWASGWHKMWIVEWFLRAEFLFLEELTNPEDDDKGIEVIHQHVREAAECLVS